MSAFTSLFSLTSSLVLSFAYPLSIILGSSKSNSLVRSEGMVSRVNEERQKRRIRSDISHLPLDRFRLVGVASPGKIRSHQKAIYDGFDVHRLAEG
ncbi:hypothetical protein CDAR_469731 [Caerostris darwini]|uniref:Uncharacterized protein n=1 Tax=Caerostris darwini TaxID=1538125 RepID=A0AAV4RN42_9ARAC|nr:hypothetical protein CDAR_469731 [Caerostris darwini]